MLYTIKNRKPLTPQFGQVYDNAGGGRFMCRYLYSDGSAEMINVSSNWCFHAHGLGVYPDGKIDWDYSTDGRFLEVRA